MIPINNYLFIPKQNKQASKQTNKQKQNKTKQNKTIQIKINHFSS